MTCSVCDQPISIIALVHRPDELWKVCETCDRPQCDCSDCAPEAVDCS